MSIRHTAQDSIKQEQELEQESTIYEVSLTLYFEVEAFSEDEAWEKVVALTAYNHDTGEFHAEEVTETEWGDAWDLYGGIDGEAEEED